MNTNELWDIDRELFRRMSTEYQSENEREFFEQMHRKQESEPSVSNDVILDASVNEDKLYFIRCWYDEYIVGVACHPGRSHLSSLAQALCLNLADVGYVGGATTLFDWLRCHNYAGVRYNNNLDKR